MTLVWEKGVRVKEQKRCLWVLENSGGKRDCVIRGPEGWYNHTNNLWVNVFKNNPVIGCLKHQGWILGNSEHLCILLELWILNTYFSFPQQIEIVVLDL